MVDRVVEVVPGRSASGVKSVAADCFFSGNSRSMSFPGLFLLEALAQLGALASGAHGSGARQDDDAQIPGYLAAVQDARFGRVPVAGDSIYLSVEFEARFGNLVRFRGIAKIGEEVAAESVLTFSVPTAK